MSIQTRMLNSDRKNVLVRFHMGRDVLLGVKLSPLLSHLEKEFTYLMCMF